MKLIDAFVRDDFGKEYCLALLKGKKRSFIQTSVGWSDWASTPMFHLTLGNNGFIDLFFYVYKFSFCLDVINQNWRRDFSVVSEEE